MLLSVLMTCIRSVNERTNRDGEPGMLRAFSLVESVVAPALIALGIQIPARGAI